MFNRINESFDKKFKSITEDSINEQHDSSKSRDHHQKKIDKILKKNSVKESVGGKWTEKAFAIVNTLDNTTELKDMLKKLLKDMSDKDVGEFLHQRGYIEYKSMNEAPVYDMSPQYDARQSFYEKARVDDNGNEKTLYSYNTPVAKIVDNKVELLPKWDWSQTTLRHVKEFLKQNGFEANSLTQMKRDYL